MRIMPTRPHSEEVFFTLVTRMREIITAEVYARVANIPMLAHYTSVDAFESMLRSREMWFSLVTDTNDTSEAVEGGRIVAQALTQAGPAIFTDFPYFKAIEQFDAMRAVLQTDTHVFSLCEHGSDSRTDRLVMWQAYGRNGTGICLVLRKESMLGQKAQGRFPVAWCPVEYDEEAALGERVKRRLGQIREVISETSEAQDLPIGAFGVLVARCLVQLVLSHKNVAFEHEKEVRFVRSRLLHGLVPPPGAEYRMITVRGAPKSKFILPMRNYPEFPIDASLPTLLDHIIIGPSARQDEMCREVLMLLDASGLDHVPVIRSEIPYRATL
jgi:hypothetical protein